MTQRKSDRIHRTKGTYRPGIHGRRGPQVDGELGAAPLEMPTEVRVIWEEIGSLARWLSTADRLQVEIAARALAALRAAAAPSAGLVNAATRALGALGMNPQSRGENSAAVPERSASRDEQRSGVSEFTLASIRRWKRGERADGSN